MLSSWVMRSNNEAAQALRVAAMSLFTNKSALGAFYRRLKAREGAPTATTATAAKLARIICAMITNKEEYRDIGEDYYEKKYKKRATNNLKRRAAILGYKLVSNTEKNEDGNEHQKRPVRKSFS